MDPFATETNVLELTAQESSLYTKFFRVCDSQGTGVVSPQAAVAFLSKSRLPKEILGQVARFNLDLADCR